MSLHSSSLIELRDTLDSVLPDLDLLEEIGVTLVNALKAGRKILTCGNGGSATDAAHMAEELTGRFKADRVALAAICLATDGAALTCIANDFGFDHIFARQVEALGQEGDILVGFSTSGRSANVNLAFEAARKRGITTIGFGGKTGGKMKDLSDKVLIVPSDSTARI